MKKSKPVAIKVLNKEVQVNCPEGAEEQLFEAARLLDQKTREIQNHGRVVGLERMLIMAGLNLSYELLTLRHQTEVEHRRLKQLQNKIDGVLMEE